MFAKVIVDVPAKQTNRPFDYIIPRSLSEWVHVGSRVGVPFGPRILQGFVVELLEQSELEGAKLREIAHVFDLYPTLTPELVSLANWMSNKYISHEITALQAMIPGALKAKYERHIVISDKMNALQESQIMMSAAEEESILSFVKKKESVPLEVLLRQFPSKSQSIKKMLESGQLEEIQRIKDRLSKKKVLEVSPHSDGKRLQHLFEELPANARRQKEVLQFFIAHTEPIKLSTLLTHLEISASTVKSLVEKGVLTIKEVEEYRDPYAQRNFPKTEPLPLTVEQQEVFRPIQQAVQTKTHETFVLHGVTGSGKTEIYLQAIQQCMDLGREAIVLVPEISLTPQMVERFKGRFGSEVAVLHSRLSQGERYDEWRKIALKQVKVGIGARSAIFAPFTNLGLIIMDEEHESSYKQEDHPKYHAREISIQRAKYHHAPVILGSATPSLESYYGTNRQSSQPSFRYLSIPSRVEGRPLPPVEVVDMREELKIGNRSMFSKSLYVAIEKRLQKKEQMVLLLNRRGHSTFVMCRSCGYVAQCPHCELSLTYHHHSKTVRCHYCGYAEREATVCPSCSSEHIRYFGTGTQKVETELQKHFPGIRVIRMDMDTTSEKGSHEKWLTMFRDKQADVLLGTQMVAKGLDFPDVTLVGVIAADTVLNIPDFRSAEKTFQLLTQVAGRAGRHQLPGEVIVQTYAPDHYSVMSASEHDYLSFIRTELEIRGQRGYPPFCRLILLTLSHESVPLLVRTSESLVIRLKEIANEMKTKSSEIEILDILGPVASPIPKIKDRYRFQCILKFRGNDEISIWVRKAVSLFDDVVKKEKLLISIDVDPQMMM